MLFIIDSLLIYKIMKLELTVLTVCRLQTLSQLRRESLPSQTWRQFVFTPSMEGPAARTNSDPLAGFSGGKVLGPSCCTETD